MPKQCVKEVCKRGSPHQIKETGLAIVMAGLQCADVTMLASCWRAHHRKPVNTAAAFLPLPTMACMFGFCRRGGNGVGGNDGNINGIWCGDGVRGVEARRVKVRLRWEPHECRGETDRDWPLGGAEGRQSSLIL